MNDNPFQSTADISHATMADTKPVSIKVLGILNVIFGLMGICGVAAAGAFMVALQWPEVREAMGSAENPFTYQLENNSFFAIYQYVSAAIGFVSACVLIAGGIGLLQYRKYGRLLSMIYGWLTVLVVIVGQILVHFIMTGSPTSVSTSAVPFFALAFSLVTRLTYPTILLIFMYKRRIQDALD